jgi:K+-sensing histidine kinase KdpD
VEALVDLTGATWPLGVSLAAIAAADRMRDSRRRAALNRSLHELRRPLQALALMAPVPARAHSGPLVEVALDALGDLDRTINGRAPEIRRRPVVARSLVESALERWRAPAAARRRALTLEWAAGPASVLVDPRRVAQALDNLIANSLDHGGLRIRVWSAVCSRGVRIAVADGGCASGPPRVRPGALLHRLADPRHGHGLAIAAAVAAEHGGRFSQWRSAAGSVALLELPLAPVPLPSARSARAGAGIGKLHRAA